MQKDYVVKGLQIADEAAEDSEMYEEATLFAKKLHIFVGPIKHKYPYGAVVLGIFLFLSSLIEARNFKIKQYRKKNKSN